MTAFTPAEKRAWNWRAFFQTYGLLLSLVLLCAVISLASDRFLTVDNLRNVLRQASINGIIS
ncbi:MAG: ABC transporter permease, partial [Anaerolineae bacterium]|nr:ABC transporter permease [Anaerolineae bacterium]